MKNILLLGAINIDLVMGNVSDWPAAGTEIVVNRQDFRIGGSTGNTACALRALGSPYDCIAGIGNDVLGNYIRSNLSNSVGQHHWVVEKSNTAVSFGALLECGDRSFISSLGHLEHFEFDKVINCLERLPASNDGIAMLSGVFFTPKLLPKYLELIKSLKDKNYEVAIDPGWPPEGWSDEIIRTMLEWCVESDYILINSLEALHLTKSEALSGAIDMLKELPAKTIIKKGKSGAYAYCPEEKHEYHASPKLVIDSKNVDTVGAGDTFNAGFLHAIAKGEQLDRAIYFAVNLASKAISTFPRKYPSSEDVSLES